MSTVRIELKGRVVEWDVIDELAAALMQNLVQNISPATREIES